MLKQYNTLGRIVAPSDEQLIPEGNEQATDPVQELSTINEQDTHPFDSFESQLIHSVDEQVMHELPGADDGPEPLAEDCASDDELDMFISSEDDESEYEEAVQAIRDEWQHTAHNPLVLNRYHPFANLVEVHLMETFFCKESVISGRTASNIIQCMKWHTDLSPTLTFPILKGFLSPSHFPPFV
jgi:hypothetical protein